MIENISLSFKGIWNHKTRSILTMLGIIIGIASIITIVSTIKGTNDQIKQNLIGSGTNAVTITLGTTDGSYYDTEYSEAPDGISVITSEACEELADINGIEAASSYVSRSWAERTYYGNQAFEGQIFGVDSHYLEVGGYRVNYGRGFLEEDFKSSAKVLIVDSKVMNALFSGQNPVGRTIEIKGEPFTVVGVAEKTAANSVVINSVQDYYMYSGSTSGSIFMPVDTWPVVYRFDEIRKVDIKASSTDDMARAGNAAANYLNENFVNNSGYEYKAANLMEQASELQALANSTSQQLIWIAGISLLVGGIGVMNIMLVSVTERTREIGLKKALGAKRKRILGQFLTEAATLTSIGGILGVVVGIVLAKLISGALGTPTSISIPACIIALAFSMVIGIVFGLIPAVKASKLNPIDALRRD